MVVAMSVGQLPIHPLKLTSSKTHSAQLMGFTFPPSWLRRLPVSHSSRASANCLCSLAFLPGTSDSAGSGYGWLGQKDSKRPGAGSEQVAASQLRHFRKAYCDDCLSARSRRLN